MKTKNREEKMKTCILVLVGLFSTVGCGGAMVDARWDKQYCEEHQENYHHANLVCRTSGRLQDCYYAEHWLEHCADARNSF